MAHRRRHGVGVLAVVLAVALTGCVGEGSGDGPTGGEDTIDPTRTVESTSVDPDVPVAEGSGCDVGDGDLADGRWFGTVATLTADSIELDIACWFIGEDAVIAAEEDGAESPPPNDYYVRNENPDTTTVDIAPDAVAVFYPTGSPDGETGTVADLVSASEDRGGYPYGVWIEVSDGVVVSVDEQWVP
ncbi:hypothetical protein GA707_07380 [Nostocoides sp. F2B08]|uniref:hypothetical protein n=1 Tax=Nostocoides sp. F2B08 TaxID=2653936 RepID=UPI00126367C6|nr:hypothetical protein [Tetrasphaera sp. F2B08]KAB7745714.1 hypothetical protein GA707_07380 [Tetrasphaera sp. F2B08]